MIYRQFQDLNLSLLGFGTMRLPKNADGSIDRPQVNEMVKYAMEHGVNYFDTAFGYHDGNSEIVTGKPLNEINFKEIFTDSNKNFYLPKVVNTSMEFYKFTNENDLKIGAFGILEPVSEEINKNLDIIFTPALMADKKGFRLGWGGGFYDRYLENFKGITICTVPNCQITDKLPVEECDIACNFVVSEKQIIKIVD